MTAAERRELERLAAVTGIDSDAMARRWFGVPARSLTGTQVATVEDTEGMETA